MRGNTRIAGVALVFVAAAADAGNDDNTLPATPAEALTRAKPLIEAARPAKSAETPDIAKGIRRAVDWMQPHVKKGSSDESWAALWNEALTLSRFHGNKPTADYVMHPETAYGGAIEYGIPVGRDWAYTPGNSGPQVQSTGEIQRRLADGGVACAIRLSRYSFNVVYSGVDGADATGLAEIFFDVYRSQMIKLDSRSPQVTAKPLSKAFPRANYFEIVGKVKDLGQTRMRCYFAKTSGYTFEFDAIEYRGDVAGATPAALWQKNVQDPELEAVLASIAEGEKKKK